MKLAKQNGWAKMSRWYEKDWKFTKCLATGFGRDRGFSSWPFRARALVINNESFASSVLGGEFSRKTGHSGTQTNWRSYGERPPLQLGLPVSGNSPRLHQRSNCSSGQAREWAGTRCFRLRDSDRTARAAVAVHTFHLASLRGTGATDSHDCL